MESQLKPNNIIDVINNHIPTLGDSESIEVYIKAIQSVTKDMVLSTLKLPDGEFVKGPRYLFKEKLSGIFNVVDYYIGRINQWSDQLSEFKNKVSESMSYSDFKALTRKLECLAYQPPSSSISPETAIRDAVRITSCCIKAHSFVVQYAVPVFLNICDLLTIGKHNVHVTEHIDVDFKRRLEGLFGHSFKIDTMVITSKDPRSWILDTDEGTLVGWCVVNTNTTGVRTIYINYNHILQYIKETNGQLTKVAKLILKTIVHECRHIFDAQTGREFDGFHIEWEDRQHEKRANKAADAFIITDHDIRWIEGILRRIESDHNK